MAGLLDKAEEAQRHSKALHDQTERPGRCFSLEIHEIIQHRYKMAGQLVPGMQVLEVGCGAGLGLGYLGACAKMFVCGEFSSENIDLLKRRYGTRQRIVRLDSHILPFAEATFDVVVALAMVYYLTLDRFIAEVRRVLRPGGTLFFCTSNKDVPGFWPAPHTTRYYSVPELHLILTTVGFEADFSGAFPAPGGSLLHRRVRAFVKDTVKQAVLLLPFGMELWVWIRSLAQQEVIPLPENIGGVECSEVETVRLLPGIRDHTYRVIYVAARKQTS